MKRLNQCVITELSQSLVTAGLNQTSQQMGVSKACYYLYTQQYKDQTAVLETDVNVGHFHKTMILHPRTCVSDYGKLIY